MTPLQKDRMNALWIAGCSYGPIVCVIVMIICFWMGGLF